MAQDPSTDRVRCLNCGWRGTDDQVLKDAEQNESCPTCRQTNNRFGGSVITVDDLPPAEV